LSRQKHDLSSFLACQIGTLSFVVDDDASMLRTVARLLRQFGYVCLPFPTAEAFANHEDFDRAVCVLLDIELGDASGIELRHRLKAANISVPVIYITGNEDPAVRKAALASGCVAFFTKPFSAQSLIEPLKKASAGRS
jgi:FixJ family two-component response regulator